MKKLLCKIGLHKWYPEDRNYNTSQEVVFRTFLVCRRCKKAGKMTFLKIFKVK